MQLFFFKVAFVSGLYYHNYYGGEISFMLLTKISILFKQARLAKGLTQFQVAEIANIDEKHYGRIERNECCNITIMTLCQICKALDINIEQATKEISQFFI